MNVPYRTTIDDVPLERGLREEEGWIDMQVQYLINSERGGSDGLTVGRTVLPPGARHDRHLHTDADGGYRFWAIAPTPYPIPHDGPVGRLLARASFATFSAAARSLEVTSTTVCAVRPLGQPGTPPPPVGVCFSCLPPPTTEGAWGCPAEVFVRSAVGCGS